MIVFFFILNIIILVLTAIKYASDDKEQLSEPSQRNLCTIIGMSLLLVFCIIFIVLYYTLRARTYFFSIILFLTILSSYISWEFFVRNNYEEDKRTLTFIVLIVLLFSVFHLFCNGIVTYGDNYLNIPFKPRHILHSFTL